MARAVACLTISLVFLFIASAKAADAPVIESVADAASGTVLWQRSDSAAVPTLKPGQIIILYGHGFGTGPITAAQPGLDPPAGGTPPVGGAVSVVPSVAEPADLELSKILFGNVRAMERNLSSYRARIDLESAASAVLSKIQNTALNYFVEDYDPAPDTRVADISAWNDTAINVRVPITAYQGPIEVIRISLNKDSVDDIRTGAPLRYRDPNTMRVSIGDTS
jgi:hypothetical protein